MAVTDALTGVYSRATLEQRLKEEVERALRYGEPFSIILLDIDHFKSINDAFGHQRGDQVLIELAQRLRTIARKSDIIYRYGGDEFLLLLPNTGKEPAEQMGQRLLTGVLEQSFNGPPALTLSISLGVATCPEDALTPETLFAKADRRHYLAKRSGRGRLVVEDASDASTLAFENHMRLIERDEALDTLQAWLAALEAARRGVLVVSGEVGSGRTRFLMEVGKIARLQGYEVINLSGSPQRQDRVFAAWETALLDWPTLPSPNVGESAFLAALENMVTEKGRSGLIVTVKGLSVLDWSSLELLRGLLLADSPLRLGLAFSAAPGHARQAFPSITPLFEVVQMQPLSKPGFHIWLRTVLRWEAPREIVDWLYVETGGMPGYLKLALDDMLERGLLQQMDGEQGLNGWEILPEMTHLNLSERLDFQLKLPPSNLPAPATGFVGRQAEIDQAVRLLNAGRLLTITGPGGAGKTRLAIQVANEVRNSFLHGLFWAPLAAIESPELLPSALAEALDLTLSGQQEPSVQLAEFLNDKQVLLVCDNFEQLIGEAQTLAELLEKAPGLKILVTSRQRLNLRSEAVLELGGMSYPTRATSDLERYGAVQLFIQSAQRSRPNFRLDSDCQDHIARICQRVEGLPLGLELAAGWLRHLSCAEIADEMDRSLDILHADVRDLPDRQRSLRAVFDHSWEMLPDNEREIFCRLAVFEGSFSRAAAAEVTGAGLLQLSILHDKSLLRRNETGYYEMHEVLHQYGLEKLAADPQLLNEVRTRHATYYCNYLQALADPANPQDMRQALQAMRAESGNLRAAWERAVQARRFDLIDHALDSLFNYYDIRGQALEGERALRQAQLMVQEQIPANASLGRKHRLLARLSSRRGAINHLLGRQTQAQVMLEYSIGMLRQLGDTQELAFALLKLSTLLESSGDLDACQQAASESLKLYRKAGQRQGAGRALNQLGQVAYLRGEYQRAEQYHRACLRIFRELDDPWSLANTLTNLGNVESELGDYLRARQFYQESLAISEALGAQPSIAAVHNNLGDIAREGGAFDEARFHLTRSIEIASQIGDRHILIIALYNLADVALHIGDLPTARRLFVRSLELSRAVQSQYGVAYAESGLAELAARSDHPADASRLYIRALRTAAEIEALPLMMKILIGLAHLWQADQRARLALEVATFARHHPATLKADRESAEHLSEELEQRLPPEQSQQAQARGQLRPVMELVSEILNTNTFTGLSPLKQT